MKGAKCRGCGKALKGTAYHLGGPAYDPVTGKQVKVNFYGGYICSDNCDRTVCLTMSASIDNVGRKNEEEAI